MLQCFITGAIEAGRKFKYSPMQALDSKEFTSGYWEWCHLFLIDAVRQDGYLSFFITSLHVSGLFPMLE